MSVEDALRIQTRYVRWRASECGAREMEFAMDKAPLLAARHALTINSFASRSEVAAAINSGEAAVLEERDPIWCDPLWVTYWPQPRPPTRPSRCVRTI